MIDNSNNLEAGLNTYSIGDLENECIREMNSNGIYFEGALKKDGELYRFSSDRKKNQPDEWYVCHEGISMKGNPYLVCVYGTWSGGGQKYYYRSYEKSRSLAIEELNVIREIEKRRQQETEEKLRKLAEERVVLAQKAWERALEQPTSDEHMLYLKNKMVDAYGVRFSKNKQDRDVLVIPIRNIEGVLQAVQYIESSGEKRIHGLKRGNFHLIGEITDQSHIRIAEGYATGASVYEALKDPVVIAMDCGNLESVIANLREKYPKHSMTIMGDDDKATAGNPGRTKAEALAKQYACQVAFPIFQDDECDGKVLTDFNDLHVHYGIEEIRWQLSQKKRHLRPMDIKSLLTRKLPPRVMIVEPWLPEQGLVMIYAERGVGKTFLALSVGYSIACGINFLKWSIPHPKRVLYVDGEMPSIALQERLVKITLGLGFKDIDPASFKIVNMDFQQGGIRDIGTKEGQNDLNDYSDEYDVLILDNLSSLLRSGEENTAESWIPVQEWMLSLRKAKKTVIFIHHAGKNGTQRGSSKKEDFLDTVIVLKHPNGYSQEDGARFEIHFEKARSFDGDKAAPIAVSLTTTDNGGLKWVMNELGNVELKKSAVKLSQEGLSQRKIAEQLNTSASTVNRLLKDAQVEEEPFED